MVYIGVVDLLVLPIWQANVRMLFSSAKLNFSGLLTGVLAIQGQVFCSNPKFIYISGAFGFGKQFFFI